MDILCNRDLVFETILRGIYWFPIKTYLEPCQTFKMERFAKIVNSLKLLTIFEKAPSLVFDRVLNMPLPVKQFLISGLSYIHWTASMRNRETVFKIKFVIKASIIFSVTLLSGAEKRDDLHIWANRGSPQMVHQQVTLKVVSSACSLD